VAPPATRTISGEDAYNLIAKCFADIRTDITAIKDKYPELAEWGPPEAKRGSLEYAHNYKPGKPTPDQKVPAPEFGPDGCLVKMWTQLGGGQCSGPAYPFLNFSIAVQLETAKGEESTFSKEIRSILGRRLAPLRELDDAVRKALIGIVSEIAAVKDKHPELVDWPADILKTQRPSLGEFSYSHNYEDKADGRPLKTDPVLGPDGCRIWVAVRPICQMQRKAEHMFPDLGIEIHADIQGKDSFLKVIRDIVGKNLEGIKELDRQAGRPPVPSTLNPPPGSAEATPGRPSTRN